MAIPDPPKAGSPFSPLWTGGWNPKTPKINNFFIPEITLRGGYKAVRLVGETGQEDHGGRPTLRRQPGELVVHLALTHWNQERSKV